MKSRHCRDIVASDPFSFLALTMVNGEYKGKCFAFSFLRLF